MRTLTTMDKKIWLALTVSALVLAFSVFVKGQQGLSLGFPGGGGFPGRGGFPGGGYPGFPGGGGGGFYPGGGFPGGGGFYPGGGYPGYPGGGGGWGRCQCRRYCFHFEQYSGRCPRYGPFGGGHGRRRRRRVMCCPRRYY